MLKAAFVVEHTRLQSRQRVQQHHGREFPTGEHKVAQTQLVRDMGIDKALVNTFIATAKQYRATAFGPLRHHRMLERGANGRKQNYRCGLGLLLRISLDTGCANRIQAQLQGLGHHHHAGAAAKGAVIDATVVAFGPVTRVPQVHCDLARAVSAASHPAFQKRGK